MSATLTARQREAFDFIKSFIAEHDIGPSLDQITVALGLKSKGNTHALVKRLVQRGAIRKAARSARCYEIVDELAPKAQGADFHLRNILRAIAVNGTVDASDPNVTAACLFVVGAPA